MTKRTLIGTDSLAVYEEYITGYCSGASHPHTKMNEQGMKKCIPWCEELKKTGEERAVSDFLISTSRPDD